MEKFFELVAKYGGAGGLIGALAVYLICSSSIGATNKEKDLLEYRVAALEKNVGDSKVYFSEIQQALMEINIKLSRFEVILEQDKKTNLKK